MSMSMSKSNSVADEKPQHAKRLKPLLTEAPCSLPIEIALSCLARVSKQDHGSLSLVSKWHRRQLISPELYEFRSRLGCTENIIYLCLVIPPEPNPRWFALFPKALDRPRRLVQVRSTLYQPPEVSSVVAHGFGIYVIGGRRISGRTSPSSSVYFLDCRSHTWATLPFMRVPRESAAAGVIDGKIYVLGGSKGDPNPGEVFDPKTQTWDALPLPEPVLLPVQDNLMYESGVVEEKIFAENEFGTAFFYKSEEGRWKRGNKNIAADKRGWHAIDKVMYCCVYGGRYCGVRQVNWRPQR
ncbi:unnamed protein product [Microthlaspi erraticum]|uniref:FKB95-like N-terminal Kelch domain-containing protein n=1 Tax=Microthlaspi erraticum TaxID=1685480 RepID=A0A6D2KAF1_9BRAS|nr:unnamed protein product [Microthlaspi erraticum]CAA7047482.1 unnamed protein product [Microthlaspi erraticum]